jgi:DNA-binding NarL/FixJ family response regulator
VKSTPSLISAGLDQVLEAHAWVHVGQKAPKGVPSFIILCVDGVEGGLTENMEQVRNSSPDVPVVVLGLRLDMRVARDALQAGARGYMHAGMAPDQVVRAVTVAATGELVAPRDLLEYLLTHEDPADLHALSARQREILGLVVEGLSNAQIANRLYLSESTIKQHLRAAYKLLGVRNRTEAARLISGRD